MKSFAYKKVIYLSFAFFTVTIVRQIFDTIIPVLLKEHFLIQDSIAGYILALDSLMALILLPLFGNLSDRLHRRLPFIKIGIIMIMGCFFFFPYVIEIKHFPLFFALYVIMMFTLESYRSPAVSLMPDVVQGKQRSLANAIVNIIGGVGAVLTLVLSYIFIPKTGWNYYGFFYGVLALFIIALLILQWKVKDHLRERVLEQTKRLKDEIHRNFIFALISVFFWNLGYYAITTSFSKYALTVWKMEGGSFAIPLLVASVGGFLAMIPIGFLSQKVARKILYLVGIIILVIACVIASFVNAYTPSILSLFIMIGLGAAFINVTLYPIVMESSNVDNVGKFTGYYYICSTSAQVLTLIVTGYLLEYLGYRSLFPYVVFMLAISAFCMSLTRKEV